MKIIDFHTHLFPDDLAPRVIEQISADTPEGRSFTDGTIDGLRASMQKSGIIRSVILPVATKAEQVSTINAFQATLDRAVFIPFGALHPDIEKFGEVVGFLQQHRIGGVKLHPEYQNFQIDVPELYPLYGMFADAGIITVFHTGKDPGFQGIHAPPLAVKKVAKAFPRLKIVAAHMGGWGMWNESYEELCGIPVYLDTSAIFGSIDPALFVRMLKKHGSERVLFGSDSPWIDQQAACRWIERLPLSGNDLERIFYRNAEVLLSEINC